MNHLFTHFINNFYWEISFEIIFLVLNPRCLTSMTHKLNPILTNINHSTSTLSLSKQNEYWKREYLIDTNLGSSNFTHEWNWVRTQMKGQFLGNSTNFTNLTNLINLTNLKNLLLEGIPSSVLQTFYKPYKFYKPWKLYKPFS